MTKKNFSGGINSLLGEDKKEQPEEEKAPEKKAQPVSRKEITKTTQEGTYEGDVRATFIIKENKLELLKALAYWERKKIKDLLDESIDSLLKTKDPEHLKKVIEEYNKIK